MVDSNSHGVQMGSSVGHIGSPYSELISGAVESGNPRELLAVISGYPATSADGAFFKSILMAFLELVFKLIGHAVEKKAGVSGTDTLTADEVLGGAGKRSRKRARPTEGEK